MIKQRVADPPLSGEGPAPALITTDPLFGSQWHLTGSYGINVASIWDDYSGRRVRIGIVDDGVHYGQRDLDGNYRADLDYDARDRDSDAFSSHPGDNHGTTVAGLIAAERGNSYGGAGVAWDSDITGFRMGYGSAGLTSQILDNMQRQQHVGISNNSCGYDV